MNTIAGLLLINQKERSGLMFSYVICVLILTLIVFAIFLNSKAFMNEVMMLDFKRVKIIFWGVGIIFIIVTMWNVNTLLDNFLKV